MSFLIYLGRTPITWFALKKCMVSWFSMEVESQALTTTDVEVCLLHILLKAFDIFLHHPPQLWCDNFLASALASNPIFHAQMKHIEFDYHFIQDRILRRDIDTRFVSTRD